MAGQRALCVGINKFQNYPQAALNGCVNDAVDMVSVLKQYMGFTDGDIVSLTDDQATKAKIMANLEEMVDGAKNGQYNYLFFSISSHGTQVPDQNKDERDYADEAFCPTDLAQKGNVWDPAHIITDDELNELFSSLPSPVELECVFDTCHSGDGLRAIDLLLDRKPRFMPPPSLEAFKQVKDYMPRGMAESLKVKGIGVEHTLWSACRSDQTSADAKITGDWHGAFTYYFCQNINKSQNKLFREELLEKVREDLEEGSFTQIPQLDTAATRRFLSAGLSKEAIPTMA
ncbi:peptidase C14 caspase catalytic subunit p20 [Methanosarcina siciliae HI350]|uniref:Peptidase C14 caspase catalytic subunit p20 n=1 Tax=Methanosarcina siciliae HI350 TaxID=1434119 RepID=A0A0E3PBV8_9EURY|nr:caspase family protein [Methanosarcina siciliae]AKB31764.1 peptidase C14 caspase catalytic subunit p20 [Methanosarcina siciliae HI350]